MYVRKYIRTYVCTYVYIIGGGPARPIREAVSISKDESPHQ